MAKQQRAQLLTQARQLAAAGRPQQAAMICRQILQTRPDVETLELLARIAASVGDHDQAATLARRCVDLQPRRAEHHCFLAEMQMEQGAYHDAAAGFIRALELTPDLDRALAGTAMAYERLGEHEAAMEVLRPRVLAGGDDLDVIATYARLEIRAGRVDEGIARLRTLLARPGLPQEARRMLGLALGKGLETAGRHDEAFAAYAAANAAAATPFDPDAVDRHTDATLELLSAERFAAMPRSSLDDGRLVFIVGMPRCGSTLVEWIIDAHPEAVGIGESRGIGQLAQSLPQRIGSTLGYPHCMTDLEQSDVDAIGRGYLGQLEAATPDATRIVDKALTNFPHLPLITLLFPSARIIHCRRDPLDTCLSCFAEPLSPAIHPYASSLHHLGRVYRQYERVMRHWRDVLEIPMLEVDYETLVGDQEQGSRTIIEHCGLPWNDACLRFHESDRVAATASYDQVRRPIYTSSVRRADRFADHLDELRSGLAGDAGPRTE